MIPLKFGYAPLHLENFSTFKEKLDAVIAQLDITTIICQVEKTAESEIPSEAKFLVTEVLIPGGTASYIKSDLLKYLTGLEYAANDLLAGEDDFYSIQKKLESERERCMSQAKRNDINHTLTFNENEIVYLSKGKNHWTRLLIPQLSFDETVRIHIYDHFLIRKQFFEECMKLLELKLQEHLEIPPYLKSPYKWKSTDQHLEIAELLYALLQNKVEIRKGGSRAKFVKQFYNLFGLDDASFHSRVQTIRLRKNEPSWLQILPDFINSLRKRNQKTKNGS